MLAVVLIIHRFSHSLAVSGVLSGFFFVHSFLSIGRLVPR
jgi:hypothetical protein